MGEEPQEHQVNLLEEEEEATLSLLYARIEGKFDAMCLWRIINN